MSVPPSAFFHNENVAGINERDVLMEPEPGRRSRKGLVDRPLRAVQVIPEPYLIHFRDVLPILMEYANLVARSNLTIQVPSHRQHILVRLRIAGFDPFRPPSHDDGR